MATSAAGQQLLRQDSLAYPGARGIVVVADPQLEHEVATQRLQVGGSQGVGVLDTGIWPEHPSFADDGSYGPSPVPAIPCEFGNTTHNANDKAFACNNKLLGARQMLETYRAVIGAEDEEFDSARDDAGHGTHTASTAAGNAKVLASIFGLPVARIAGIAPRARVVAYKALGELGGFTSDLACEIYL